MFNSALKDVVEIIRREPRLVVRENHIINSFCSYVNSIDFWRRTHNIVSARYNSYDLWENIYDSIFLYNVLPTSSKIIDAGAGAGFPGVPLAIIFPLTKFILVDHDRKKCSFLRLVKAKLNLKNLEVLNNNLEAIQLSDVIITKAAFAPAYAHILAQSMASGGRIVIWATANTTKEFSNALCKHDVALSRTYDYTLPSGKKRCLLLFTKSCSDLGLAQTSAEI
jgi:16S rRNA (guanine(527)-N(7))-methyltransferase RsmG